MEVAYIDHMGTDLSVVNAARVSFNKSHEVFDNTKDSKLIKYLAKHDHWTPFAHTAITLHFKAPIFVARQLGKHQVGMVWNEVSRRYVDDDPEFYIPKVWRETADNVKQGSSEEKVDEPLYLRLHPSDCRTTDQAYQRYLEYAFDLYRDMLDNDTCPEQARMILPQSMYTEWYWTGSLPAFARVYNLRVDSHTQKETQEVVKKIDPIINDLFPVSWEVLKKV